MINIKDLGTEKMFKFAFSSKINPVKTGPYPTIGVVFSNGANLIFSVTDVMVINVLEKVLDVTTCIHHWNTLS
jgi:hypothetical protein